MVLALIIPVFFRKFAYNLYKCKMRNSVYSGKGRGSVVWSHLGALLAVTVWGVSFVSTKVILDHGFRPAEVYVYRFILAYLLVLIACHKRLWSNSFRDEILFMVCGLCAGSIYFIAENTAIEYTLVSNVSLITSISPLITAFMLGLIYKNEKPGKGVYISSAIALVGVACVIFNSSFVVKMNPIGDLLSLLAAVSWSIYSIVLRKLNAVYSTMFITRKTFFYGMLTAVPYMLTEPTITPIQNLLNVEVLLNLLFLGAFASMFAYILWAQAVKSLGAIQASNYIYLSPIVTLVASVLLLDEHITWIGYMGCALILGGMWLGDKVGRGAESRKR